MDRLPAVAFGRQASTSYQFGERGIATSGPLKSCRYCRRSGLPSRLPLSHPLSGPDVTRRLYVIFGRQFAVRRRLCRRSRLTGIGRCFFRLCICVTGRYKPGLARNQQAISAQFAFIKHPQARMHIGRRFHIVRKFDLCRRRDADTVTIRCNHQLRSGRDHFFNHSQPGELSVPIIPKKHRLGGHGLCLPGPARPTTSTQSPIWTASRMGPLLTGPLAPVGPNFVSAVVVTCSPLTSKPSGG